MPQVDKETIQKTLTLLEEMNALLESEGIFPGGVEGFARYEEVCAKLEEVLNTSVTATTPSTGCYLLRKPA
jgi:hypothetical protein